MYIDRYDWTWLNRGTGSIITVLRSQRSSIDVIRYLSKTTDVNIKYLSSIKIASLVSKYAFCWRYQVSNVRFLSELEQKVFFLCRKPLVYYYVDWNQRPGWKIFHLKYNGWVLAAYGMYLILHSWNGNQSAYFNLTNGSLWKSDYPSDADQFVHTEGSHLAYHGLTELHLDSWDNNLSRTTESA